LVVDPKRIVKKVKMKKKLGELRGKKLKRERGRYVWSVF